MKCKFEFKPVEKTFSDPVAAVFKPGTPFGREYSRGDIVLLHPEISSSKVFLNSLILRDALLDSKEYIEEKLGIIITEKTEEPKAKKSTKKTKETVKVEEPVEEKVEEPIEEPIEEVVNEQLIEDLTIE